jgi:hypothetical protein
MATGGIVHYKRQALRVGAKTLLEKVYCCIAEHIVFHCDHIADASLAHQLLQEEKALLDV